VIAAAGDREHDRAPAACAMARNQSEKRCQLASASRPKCRQSQLPRSPPNREASWRATKLLRYPPKSH
jgi:hypothetical protein